MKKVNVFSLIGCIVILLMGCVPSLHPYYSDKDLVYEPKLEGTWMGENGKDTYIFKHTSGKEYTLIMYSDDSNPADFDAYLFKLGKTFYLDTYPQNLDIKNEFEAMHAVKTHNISKIKINKDTIEASMIDTDVLKKFQEKNQLKCKYEMIDGEIVFKASPAELREFVRKNSNVIFAKPQTFTRKE